MGKGRAETQEDYSRDARISSGLAVCQVALNLYSGLGDRDRIQFCPEGTLGNQMTRPKEASPDPQGLNHTVSFIQQDLEEQGS